MVTIGSCRSVCCTQPAWALVATARGDGIPFLLGGRMLTRLCSAWPLSRFHHYWDRQTSHGSWSFSGLSAALDCTTSETRETSQGHVKPTAEPWPPQLSTTPITPDCWPFSISYPMEIVPKTPGSVPTFQRRGGPSGSDRPRSWQRNNREPGPRPTILALDSRHHFINNT